MTCQDALKFHFEWIKNLREDGHLDAGVRRYVGPPLKVDDGVVIGSNERDGLGAAGDPVTVVANAGRGGQVGGYDNVPGFLGTVVVDACEDGVLTVDPGSVAVQSRFRVVAVLKEFVDGGAISIVPLAVDPYIGGLPVLCIPLLDAQVELSVGVDRRGVVHLHPDVERERVGLYD